MFTYIYIYISRNKGGKGQSKGPMQALSVADLDSHSSKSCKGSISLKPKVATFLAGMCWDYICLKYLGIELKTAFLLWYLVGLGLQSVHVYTVRHFSCHIISRTALSSAPVEIWSCPIHLSKASWFHVWNNFSWKNFKTGKDPIYTFYCTPGYLRESWPFILQTGGWRSICLLLYEGTWE